MEINDLIKELCPNGVMFYKLSEIGEHYTGLSGKSKKDFENGNFKYITYSNIFNNPSTNLNIEDYVQISNNEKQNEIKYKDILIAGSSENLEDSGMISVVTKLPKEKIYLNSFCFGFRLNNIFYEKFNADFLKHLFRNKNFRNEIVACSFGVTRYNLSKEKFLKIKIPCPPLEIQEEIIRILDKFCELESELESELEARKSQYEFWRGKLFDNDYEIERLGDLCSIKTGSKPKEIFDNGNYEYINAGTTNSGFTDVVNAKGDCVTTPSRGQGGIGFVGFQTNDFWCGPLCYQIRTQTDKLINKYLYYYMLNHNKFILGLKHEGGVPAVNIKELQEMPIKVPTLDEQKHIVEVLDKFDALINDITEGIPAEIELRRQQYEYYRNKLLNFEELKAN